LLDDTSREFEKNTSWSQTFLQGAMSTIQDAGSGSLKAALTAVGGGASGLAFLSSIASGKGFSGSAEEARQTWNQVRGGVWNYYFDKGKALGLDDNLSKMYAHGVLQGWSAAAEKQLGAAMPQLQQYGADRDQAVLARAEYLQGQGYGSAEARQRAEQEVSLAEKAGQTGMNNWAGKIVEGEKLFHQAREARFHMSAGPGPSGKLQQYEPFIMRAAQIHAVDPGLIRSVIMAESKGNPRAVSPKGAMGLMQLMPGTASDMGVKNPYDPEQNIMGGTKYLRQMLSKFNGDVSKAVTAYHSGPEPVMKGEQPGPKTAKYVNEVMRHYLAQQKVDKMRLM
jgi:soluble lytic murein transglycosylase-like protein